MSGRDGDPRTFTYFVGIGLGHSLSPPLHDFVSYSLDLGWKFKVEECARVEDAIRLFREPTFAGGVITMPYKTAIMEHLDGLDEYCVKIGACNNVYRAVDGSLLGSNTDWCGVEACLATASSNGKGKPALIVGAGGAARAAIYALHERLNCNPIYVVNRDKGEVDALLLDTKSYGPNLSLVHLDTLTMARDVSQALSPFYIVGCVPDFKPQSAEELEGWEILTYFLQTTTQKGVLLDLCYKPRRTRLIQMGDQYNWHVIEGIMVVGRQVQEQYRLWCGEDIANKISLEEAWKVLQKAAENSRAINF
ncbi:shikimate [Talaromyces proteolyticus]|uniref:Shikimate n=1 Tax=Talaromyces proteolyticus TaxID=1131652 RepID=A0AAD4KNJ4_9EURO|nr:shikimate [Talaromyces proteolyticus]KAH8696747.1 shikimate [Talaromyces proteolyticus]